MSLSADMKSKVAQLNQDFADVISNNIDLRHFLILATEDDPVPKPAGEEDSMVEEGLESPPKMKYALHSIKVAYFVPHFLSHTT